MVALKLRKVGNSLAVSLSRNKRIENSTAARDSCVDGPCSIPNVSNFDVPFEYGDTLLGVLSPQEALAAPSRPTRCTTRPARGECRKQGTPSQAKRGPKEI